MKSKMKSSPKELAVFNDSINSKIQAGFVLEERNDELPFAVMSKRKRFVNHKLNFSLACVTLGIWSFVWVYINHISKARKIVLGIDEDGHFFEENCLL